MELQALFISKLHSYTEPASLQVCQSRDQVVEIFPLLKNMADTILHIIPEVAVVKKCGGTLYNV